MNALKWLKANNTLYAYIEIVDNWIERAIADDEELIMSTLQRPECEDDNVSIEPEYIHVRTLVTLVTLVPNMVTRTVLVIHRCKPCSSKLVVPSR